MSTTDYLINGIDINGIDIVISKNLIKEYVQKRKHHKRRINKKWAKKYGSKPIYDMNYYFIDNKIYMSPRAFEELKPNVILNLRRLNYEVWI